MRKLVLLFSLMISTFSFGQIDSLRGTPDCCPPTMYRPTPQVKVHQDVYEKASFKEEGGIQYFAEKNFKPPRKALKKGLVACNPSVRITVEEDGSLSDIENIGQFMGNEIEEEVVRILKKSSGRWVPAKKNGIPYKSSFNLVLYLILKEY